jgi:predicted DNA-binding WGR domain protein
LNKSGQQLNLSELQKFHVNDPFYNQSPQTKNDYLKDSELFLKSQPKFLEDQKSQNADKEYFTVDRLSNMQKIGRLIWDKKSNVPYDVILTKTDVSYGLYGMHNFYKMQLITHSYNDQTDDESKNNQMCVLFTRWGRIGDQGQCQRTPYASLTEAKDEFFKLFKSKTGNDFVETVIERKKQFEAKPRRYSLVKLESRRRPKLKDISFDLFEQGAKSQLTLFAKSRFGNHENANNYRHFWADLLDVNFLKTRIHQGSIISGKTNLIGFFI